MASPELCGSYAGLNAHKREGSEPCPECRLAGARYMTRLRRRRDLGMPKEGNTSIWTAPFWRRRAQSKHGDLADPALFEIAPLVTPDYAPEQTIQQRWEAWSSANPWVMDEVERLADQWLAAGHTRIGLKQIWEVIRYGYGVTTGDQFKANNDFTSRAGRALAERRPDLADAIEFRALRAA